MVPRSFRPAVDLLKRSTGPVAEQVLYQAVGIEDHDDEAKQQLHQYLLLSSGISVSATRRDGVMYYWETGKGFFNSLATYDAMGEAEEPSKAPAAALGIVGLAALGIAGYFVLRPKSAVAAPLPAPAPHPVAAPAPKPAKQPATASKPAYSPSAAPSQSVQFSVGQHVQGQWTDGNWYGAKVINTTGSGVDVEWDDGTGSMRLSPSQVRPGGAAPAPAMSAHGGAAAPPAPVPPPASPVDVRTQTMAECFQRGGTQIDEHGGCWDGDKKIG